MYGTWIRKNVLRFVAVQRCCYERDISRTWTIIARLSVRKKENRKKHGIFADNACKIRLTVMRKLNAWSDDTIQFIYSFFRTHVVTSA